MHHGSSPLRPCWPSPHRSTSRQHRATTFWEASIPPSSATASRTLRSRIRPGRRPGPTARPTPDMRASTAVTRSAAARCSSTSRVPAARDAIGRGARGATSRRTSPTWGASIERTLLIESVLEPSRQIVEGYRPTIVATADGRVLSGIVKGESAQELTLVDAEGRRQVDPQVRDRREQARHGHRSCRMGWPRGSRRATSPT